MRVCVYVRVCACVSVCVCVCEYMREFMCARECADELIRAYFLMCV